MKEAFLVGTLITAAFVAFVGMIVSLSDQDRVRNERAAAVAGKSFELHGIPYTIVSGGFYGGVRCVGPGGLEIVISLSAAETLTKTVEVEHAIPGR